MQHDSFLLRLYADCCIVKETHEKYFYGTEHWNYFTNDEVSAQCALLDSHYYIIFQGPGPNHSQSETGKHQWKRPISVS